MADETSEPLEFAQDLAEFSLESRRAEGASPSSSAAVGEWYARSLGLDFGPMPWADLVDMASRGVISPGDDVRQGTTGNWLTAGSVPELAVAFAAAGSENHPAADTTTSAVNISAAVGASQESAAVRPRSRRWVLGGLGVAGILLAGSAAWVLFREPGDAARLAQLRSIHAEMKSLRERRAPEAEWLRLTERVKSDVLPWVESNRRREASLSPAGKELSVAARDHLLPMLGESRRAAKGQEAEFLRRLEEAERKLTGR